MGIYGLTATFPASTKAAEAKPPLLKAQYKPYFLHKKV